MTAAITCCLALLYTRFLGGESSKCREYTTNQQMHERQTFERSAAQR
jgi:hypothetical protein